MKNPKVPPDDLYCVKGDKNIDLNFSALKNL